MKWAEILIIYNFRILYIKGKENIKVNTFNKKLKYFKNKIYKLKVILKANKDILVFNKLQITIITILLLD